MPLTFSIIIPVYNVAPYLAECLDSVRAQTYADWEALCVDDGSSDTSTTLLDTYARLDPRIHIIHQRNAGVSSARNRALDSSHGDWIWFVDADDAIHPQALSYLFDVVQAARRRPQAISFEILFADHQPKWNNLHSTSRVCEVDECTETIFWRFRAGACRTLFAREQIGPLRFEPFGMGEDMLFSLTFFAGMTHWTLLDEALYFYRKRQGSACHSPIKRGVVRDWLSVQERLIDELLVSRRLFVLGGGYYTELSALVGWTPLLYFWRDVLQVARVRNAAVLCSVGGPPRALLDILPLSALQTVHYSAFKTGTEASLGKSLGLLAASYPACALSSLNLFAKLETEEAA
ncbi:MAG: glycosyltransferase family 2 protein [Candidatus Spyradenecus sp.]